MNSVAKIIIVNLLARKSIQLTLLMVFISLGVFTTLGYQNFLYLQAQNVSQLSVFNEVIKPLAGLTLLFEVLLCAIVAAQMMPYWISRGQQGLLLQSARQSSSILRTALQVLLVFFLMPLIYFCLIYFALYFFSDMDIFLFFSTVLGLILGGLLFSLAILADAFHTKSTLTALLHSFVVIVLIFSLDEWLKADSMVTSFSILSKLFIHLRDGLIIPAEIFTTLLWISLLYWLTLLVLKKIRAIDYATSLLFFLGLLSVTLFMTFYGSNYFGNLQWDISRAKLNSLDSQMSEQLETIEQPVFITAIIDDEKNRDEIFQAFTVIKNYQPKSQLEFSNRQALSDNNDYVDQFVTVKIGNNQQSLRYPFDRPAKESLSRLIVQLSGRAEQWITFIEGHGEASPFVKSNRGIGEFYQALKKLGWPVAVQNLIKQPIISDNTKILVIAASKNQWLPQEINLLMDYLTRGGNLLLLREQDDLIPQALKDYLSIKKMPGILIDWQGYQSGTPHPAVLIINQFNQHPVNTKINSLLAFPWSVGLSHQVKDFKLNRNYLPILKTHSGVWNEFDSEQTELAFNEEKGEQQKAFSLGYSILDKLSGQRMIVIGDSSFLSDSAINNYANRQFALNLVSWLSAEKSSLVETRNLDNFIQISGWSKFVLSWFFSLVLPLIVLMFMVVKRIRKDS